jgi:hypothetical protein
MAGGDPDLFIVSDPAQRRRQRAGVRLRIPRA